MNLSKLLAAGVLVLSLAACENAGQKQTVGSILGAIAGAAIGSQIGSGAGKAVAIGVGALLGGVAGGELGRELDRRDQEYADAAAERAINETPTGSSSTWQNPDSGHSGTYTPIEDPYRDASGAHCRRVQSTYEIEGEVHTGESTLCRMPDGSLQVVS